VTHASTVPDYPEPQHTAPFSVLVGTLSGMQNAIIPAAALTFSTGGLGGAGLLVGLFAAFMITAAGALFSFIRWKRLTYLVGDQDIRVESGILSRAARSVPYERIQDVSLEQKLLPRILGLVEVKFETGAGGADDLALAYLKEHEGERLRELVRERREDISYSAEAVENNGPSDGNPALEDDKADVLFSMGPSRLFTYGLFEFSLAVFAVLAGMLQYADNFLDIEVWDFGFWRDLAEEQGGWLLELGAYGQVLSAIAGLISVFFIGSATGMFRTFTREWGFLLERTARGFRRRRGLFTRTDVVMPVHRVQGVTIGTGFIRYRFGWHSLKFVSLAQDAGSSSHVVAPFARLKQLEPIVEAAGFAMPKEDAQWHRATLSYRNVSIVGDVLLFAIAAIFAGVMTWIFAPEWVLWSMAGPVILAVLDALAGFISWRFKRHTLDDNQIVATAGVLSPKTKIATRVKLHSVEIEQGPLARYFGYATLHLGMAGAEFAIPGIPLDRARALRAQVLETIAATDFSRLEAGNEEPV